MAVSMKKTFILIGDQKCRINHPRHRHTTGWLRVRTDNTKCKATDASVVQLHRTVALFLVTLDACAVFEPSDPTPRYVSHAKPARGRGGVVPVASVEQARRTGRRDGGRGDSAAAPHGWARTPGGPLRAAPGLLSGPGPSQPLSSQLRGPSRLVRCSWQHLRAISG